MEKIKFETVHDNYVTTLTALRYFKQRWTLWALDPTNPKYNPELSEVLQILTEAESKNSSEILWIEDDNLNHMVRYYCDFAFDVPKYKQAYYLNNSDSLFETLANAFRPKF